ncbi:MAG: hypothetical protein BWY71_00865 [Planctomycetes bacterium ADurb.Bin412]|nr:MAG: hypothetical protein BWY71_00865 [Planctomycetes bacterium ADurb.Bin412]
MDYLFVAFREQFKVVAAQRRKFQPVPVEIAVGNISGYFGQVCQDGPLGRTRYNYHRCLGVGRIAHLQVSMTIAGYTVNIRRRGLNIHMAGGGRRIIRAMEGIQGHRLLIDQKDYGIHIGNARCPHMHQHRLTHAHRKTGCYLNSHIGRNGGRRYHQMQILPCEQLPVADRNCYSMLASLGGGRRPGKNPAVGMQLGACRKPPGGKMQNAFCIRIVGLNGCDIGLAYRYDMPAQRRKHRRLIDIQNFDKGIERIG